MPHDQVHRSHLHDGHGRHAGRDCLLLGELADGGSEGQCRWLKDKYGISWQIAQKRMNEMLRDGTPEQRQRVTQAFMPMKKFDMAALEKAFKG